MDRIPTPTRSWCLQHRALPLSAQHAARVPGGIGRVTRQFVPQDVRPMQEKVA